jgi:DNA-binding CsgD family transcriptional regulator
MADHAASPFPAPTSPLVGREREQATLRDALAVALTGRGSLVLIGGEAGIGKTALAEDLLAEARARGALVRVGRCYDLSETPPYAPWAEAFGHSAPVGGLLSRPSLAGRDGTGQVVSISTARDYLAALATSKPVVLLLDDLHWADQESLDLLRMLARSLGDMQILILATYRAEELDRSRPLHALLPLIAREARAAQIALTRLTDDDVRTLVRARYRLDRGDTARLVAHVRERSQGNPFFAGELLRALEDERILAPSTDGWRLGSFSDARVPALLRQVIGGRIARLGEAAERLLALAAVIGQDVPLDLWGTVGAVDEEALGEVLEAALAARVLEETASSRRVRFAHALIRAALYEGLSLPRRRRWHRQVAEALLAQPEPDPDAVAAHLHRAGDDRATVWLIRAGERAWQADAWFTAAERFAAALALIGTEIASVERRATLLLRLALLRRYATPAAGIPLLDEAEQWARQSGLAPLAYARGLLRSLAGDRARGVAEIGAGVAALEAFPVAERVRLAPFMAYCNVTPGTERGLHSLLLAMNGQLVAGAAEGERTLAASEGLAAEYRQAGSFTDAWFGLFIARTMLGDPAAGHRIYLRTREHLQALGHYHGRWVILLCALELLVLTYYPDDLAWRRALAAEAEEALARTSGTSPHGLLPAWAGVPLRWVAGEWAAIAALPWDEASIRRSAELPVAAVAPRLALAQGRIEDAWFLVREHLPDGAATPPGATELHCGLAAQRVAATLALDADDLVGADAWLGAHEHWLAWSGAVPGRSEGAQLRARYWAQTGDLARARNEAGAALALASSPRQPLALLAAHRLLGELGIAAGDREAAEAHLSASLALAQACAAPYERALTLLAMARLRGEQGEPEEGCRLAAEARALLVPLGANPAIAHADGLAVRLIAAAGAARTPREASPFGLTPREAEVLGLVARGLHNQDIADRLSLSRRTVEQHLRSAYDKLDVHNRAAATRRAIEHGLA